MVRDLLGYRIRRHCYLEFYKEMEKYYIYNDKIYQIIRMSKHYKLDGGWYVDISIRNINTNKISSIFIPYKIFKEKKLYDKKPKLKEQNEETKKTI
jgi:hypothetical protein